MCEEANRYALTPLPPLAIPTTLQDSLMARLDDWRPPNRSAARRRPRREFPYELIRAVASMDETTVQQAAQL